MKKAILTMALVAGMANAVDVELSWTHTTQDRDGNQIDPAVISYALYVSTDGGPVTEVAKTVDNKKSLYGIAFGCHTFHVLAHRSDSDLHSVPSNSVSKCIDADTEEQVKLMMPAAPTELKATMKF